MHVFGDEPCRTDPERHDAATPKDLPPGISNRAMAQLARDRRSAIPFANRYAPQGPRSSETVTEGGGGLVQVPARHRPQPAETSGRRIAVMSGRSYADMPTGEERTDSQAKVMGVGANEAARQLGLPTPQKLSWEWLHLVAHSMKPTHMGALSEQSRTAIARTGQPQQTQENLVLGTAAANTVMLSYETAIKRILEDRPDWTVDVWVAATVDERPLTVKKKSLSIPLATWIDYHVMFRTGDGQVVPPVVLAFDPSSHDKPPKDEFHAVVDALEQQIAIAVPAEVKGIRTKKLASVEPQRRGRRARKTPERYGF